MNKLFFNNQRGFTLVELLIVISLIGILTGVTISIINPKKQRDVAEDAVRQSNLEKYALGIEAYANANSKYPDQAEMIPDANNKPSGVEAFIFISKIPNDEPTLGVEYLYFFVAATATEPEAFGVYVAKTNHSTYSVANSPPMGCFKYRSTWGKIKECFVNCSGTADGDC